MRSNKTQEPVGLAGNREKLSLFDHLSLRFFQSDRHPGELTSESGITMQSTMLLILFCALLAPALAVAETGEGALRRPLDLSLPRDFRPEHWNPPSTETARSVFSPSDIGQPPTADADYSRNGGGRRNDLPYGSGFEARQSGSGNMGSGGGSRRGGGRGR